MSRPLRLEFPGAYYHVMNRGTTRQPIFLNNQDRSNFLRGILEIQQRWNCRIFAYCLMPNHYHLCLQTSAIPLSRLMRHVDGVYTQRFNRSHQRDGPLFRGRYKSKLIEEDAYLLAVARYIHQNPKDLGIKEKNYPWSSLRYYFSVPKPEWLDISFLLAYFGGSRIHLMKFMESSPAQSEVAYNPETCTTPFFGSQLFQEWLVTQTTQMQNEREMPERHSISPSFEACLKMVSKVFKQPLSSLLHSGRGLPNPGRRLAMYTCLELGGQSHREIASRFGLRSYSTVSSICSIIRSQLPQDANLSGKWRTIQDLLLKNRQ